MYRRVKSCVSHKHLRERERLKLESWPNEMSNDVSIEIMEKNDKTCPVNMP